MALVKRCITGAGLLASVLLFGGVNASVQADTTSLPRKVTDIAGASHSIPNRGQKATVLVFISYDCPISNGYAPEITRIANDYARRGVQLFVIYAESDFSAKSAREHARQYGYRVPALIDANHAISASVGATITPEVAVLAPGGQRLYLGRIDNRYIGFGRKRTQASERDVRLALDAILAGQPVPHSTTTAIGCFIPTSSK